MRFVASFAIVGLIAGFAAGQERPSSGPATGTITTEVTVAGLEPGRGVEHRAKLAEVVELLKENDVAKASAICDAILAEFAKLMTDPATTYVSLANKAEYEHFVKANPKLAKVEWLDFAYGQLLHQRTFMAAGQKKYRMALQLARQEVAGRPYAADSFTEYGFVLNKLGRGQEALEAYENALKLCSQFASNRANHAMTLRGVGFTLIDLGRLDEATDRFEQSLRLDPGNKTALSELDYIRSQKAKRAVPKPQ